MTVEDLTGRDVTVVTATVNRPTLKRAVQSVQDQTVKPARHCILLQQIMRQPVLDLDPPSSVPIDIRWLPPPQPSLTSVYNMADEMAATPLVAMLDDDCWWEPQHLEILLDLMRETEADFVWASSIVEDAHTGYEKYRRNDPTPAFQHIDTNEILFRKSCIYRWGGFFDETPGVAGIDGHRIERWVRSGATYAHSPVYTVHYGWRPVPEYV